MINTNTILDFLKQAVETKTSLNSEVWIDAAQKLVVLLGDEEAKLYDYQQKVALLKVMFLDGQDKKNVSECQLRTEASEEYKKYKKQDLAKKMSDRESGF